jgi:triacylglycerol lipase
MEDERNSELAAELLLVVVSVDYRLAPEAPYPAAMEDCYAVLTWLRSDGGQYAIDPTRIGVVGESAGGGLAASLSLVTRDRGEIALSFQWLLYPMIDDRTGRSGAPHPFAGDFIWTVELNRGAWQSFLGSDRDALLVGPYAAAARVDNLSGLPPTLIQTGALDLFIEENIGFARRLIGAGVPTELHVYPGAVHGFASQRSAWMAIAARRDSAAALKRAFLL